MSNLVHNEESRAYGAFLQPLGASCVATGAIYRFFRAQQIICRGSVLL